MEGRLVLKDCSLYRSEGSLQVGRAVVIEQGRITQVGPDEQLPILPGDWEIACRGRLAIPGLIDCHAQLVGGQLVPLGDGAARGAEQASRRERMESALTAAEVDALTCFALARALRSGVTTVFDQLRCPAEVGGGLEAQARAAERLGIRLVASHATQSSDSHASAQLEENAERARARQTQPLVRCALGFRGDASDELFAKLGRWRADLGVGVHGDLEGQANVGRGASVDRLIARLDLHGLLKPECVFGCHSAPDLNAARRLARTGAVLALSPLSAWMQGSLSSRWWLLDPSGGRMVLGTAGSVSLWDEVLAAVAELVSAAGTGDSAALLRKLLLSDAAAFCSQIFGRSFGAIEAGYEADIVVYDLVPGGEGHPGLAASQWLRLARAPVAWTIVAGRVVVREGRLLAHDYVELDGEAQRALDALRRRTPGVTVLP